MMSNSNEFSATTESALLEAGWYPGRLVDEKDMEKWYAFRWDTEAGYCRIFPSALRVVREFGGLSIKQSGLGITCSRSSFVIDPLAALGILDRIWSVYEWCLDTVLYPLGTYGSQEAVLSIDPVGRVYLMGGGAGIKGQNFHQALNNLITGVMSEEIHVSDPQGDLKRGADAVRDAVRRLHSFNP